MTSHPTSRRTRRTLSRILAGTSASLLVLTTVAAFLSPPATAAAPAAAWGPDGTFATDSSLTVRWDNAGNPTSSVVPRDASQTLPHTGAKTYADLDPALAAEYGRVFGDLQVTVAQTKNLVNQSIEISAIGAEDGHTTGTGSYLEVFQCWGAPKADGSPDPSAEQPDPATCQTGVSTANDNQAQWLSTLAAADANLVLGGDWENLAWTRDPQTGSPSRRPDALAVPFQTIDGKTVSDRLVTNPYFSPATTNELSGNDFKLRQDGGAERPFEVQTTIEAGGLGCGVQQDRASTARCWLVVVPKDNSSDSLADVSRWSPLSPTVWANRLQVELGMSTIDARCPSGASRTLLTGSELLSQAMASWIPAMCTQADSAVGYTVLGDAQVRRELDASTRQSAVLSIPGAADTFDVPLALAGTVIAYRVDSYAGEPISQLKLNPRLVAKLLTQTYLNGMDEVIDTQLEEKAPWTSSQDQHLVAALADDPEFRTLNGGTPPFYGSGGNGDLLASLFQSDGAAQIWKWVLADKGARAFLHGCPDDSGMTINPFFSTRTYEECPAQRGELDKITADRIAQTKSPETYTYATPTYPPDAVPFSQPGWYARDSVLGPVTDAATGETTEQVVRTGMSLSDLHPRLNDLNAVGRSVAKSIYPSNQAWCPTSEDQTCLPKPGKWKQSSVRQGYGYRYVIGITDSVTAARSQLQTALLCSTDDSAGEHCVGATQASLTTAAEHFDDGTGTPIPAGTTDYAAGAYPLTLPIYASVAKKGLETAQAKGLASILGWLTTTGQTTGYDLGELPPGYAPLTTDLNARAAESVAKLAAWVPPTTATTTTPPTAPTGMTPQSTTKQAVAAPRAAVPVQAPAAAVAAAQSAASAPSGAVANPALVAQVGTTPPTESGFPQFALAMGLVAALITGIASPLVGGPRRSRS
ncbi:hypothetical protein [uncultured Microbacterium sp.]|uniref:hypothetical protein n=1 Tax=uncultured Microbacterium sp. TaxID=191216 RepID=UPI0035CAE997